MATMNLNETPTMKYQPSVGYDAGGLSTTHLRIADGILSCIWRQKLLIISMTLTLTMVAIIIVLAIPKTFMATGSVIVGQVGTDAVNLGGKVPQGGALERDTMASEVEILNSRELLGRMVTQLNLASNPAFNPNMRSPGTSSVGAKVKQFVQSWFPATDVTVGLPRAEMEYSDTINFVRQHLQVAQEGQSRVIRCSYSSRDPIMAALVVNTLMSLYADDYTRLREGANKKAHDWITLRLSDLRARADSEAQAVEAYRTTHGFMRGRESTLLQEEITQLNTALGVARQQREDAESTLRTAQRRDASHGGDHLGAVLDSPLIQRLREQEVLVAARVAEMSNRYGLNSPILAATKAQLVEIRQSIATQITRINNSLFDKLTVAKSNEDALSAQLKVLRSKVAQMEADNAVLQGLERQASVERDLYANFLSRSKETDPWLEYPAAWVRVLSSASTPTYASFPNKKIALPFALFSSIVMAIIVALVADSRKRGILSMDEVSQLLGLPSLGLIPFSKRLNVQGDMLFQEAISHLFVRLLPYHESTAQRSILVTSTIPGEGKSSTALALAREGTARGLNVLLVDADLRSCSLSKLASQGAAAVGLAEVLRGDANVDHAIQFSPKMGVLFLGAGTTFSNPGHLFSLPSLRATIKILERHYDLVVIDSPPVLVGVDTSLLGNVTGTTVLLTRWRHTLTNQVALAIKFLTASRTRISGVVLSMVNVNQNAQYGHGDSVLFSPAMHRYYSRVPVLTHQQRDVETRS